MLLAHAPAGYLLGRLISRVIFKDMVHPKRSDRFYQILIFAGIIGAVIPDIDFIYHIFIDSDRTPHHAYFTHMPFFWIGLFLVLFFVGKLRGSRKFIAVSTVGCMSAMLHLVCDTLTGIIYWFYPLSTKGVNVFAVADVHVWWVKNFTYHWTFLVEIIIALTAMVVFLRIRETIIDGLHLFRHSAKLRAITMRIGICTAGLLLVVLVGSMRFNIDNRIIQKVIALKHHVVKMASSL